MSAYRIHTSYSLFCSLLLSGLPSIKNLCFHEKILFVHAVHTGKDVQCLSQTWRAVHPIRDLWRNPCYGLNWRSSTSPPTFIPPLPVCRFTPTPPKWRWLQSLRTSIWTYTLIKTGWESVNMHKSGCVKIWTYAFIPHHPGDNLVRAWSSFCLLGCQWKLPCWHFQSSNTYSGTTNRTLHSEVCCLRGTQAWFIASIRSMFRNTSLLHLSNYTALICSFSPVFCCPHWCSDITHFGPWCLAIEQMLYSSRMIPFKGINVGATQGHIYLLYSLLCTHGCETQPHSSPAAHAISQAIWSWSLSVSIRIYNLVLLYFLLCFTFL